MITLLTVKRRQAQMIKRRNAREHRKFHLDKANEMRAHAEEFKDVQEKQAIAIFGYVPKDIQEIITNNYTNTLAEAIAEENSKCVDDGRHN